MQAHSYRTLGAPYYDDDVIEAFIGGVGTMDDTLLDDGTYFAAILEGRIVGCGGWSWRTPAYTARMTNAAPTPSATKANVRSVYVHPDFARRGIAREIMTAIEAEITAAGFAAASLTATLSGIPLYRRLGYRGGEPVSLALGNSLTFVGLGMSKILAQGVRKAA
jgi:GNAT superfamily N-acetyltransferase